MNKDIELPIIDYGYHTVIPFNKSGIYKYDSNLNNNNNFDPIFYNLPWTKAYYRFIENNFFGLMIRIYEKNKTN